MKILLIGSMLFFASHSNGEATSVAISPLKLVLGIPTLEVATPVSETWIAYLSFEHETMESRRKDFQDKKFDSRFGGGIPLKGPKGSTVLFGGGLSIKKWDIGGETPKDYVSNVRYTSEDRFYKWDETLVSSWAEAMVGLEYSFMNWLLLRLKYSHQRNLFWRKWGGDGVTSQRPPPSLSRVSFYMGWQFL